MPTTEPDLASNTRKADRILRTYWRDWVSTGAYLVTGASAAWGAFAAPLPIGIEAGLLAWSVVALVRVLDGRFSASGSKAVKPVSRGQRLLTVWLLATAALFAMLMAERLIDVRPAILMFA